jgi:hypothetical protein
MRTQRRADVLVAGRAGAERVSARISKHAPRSLISHRIAKATGEPLGPVACAVGLWTARCGSTVEVDVTLDGHGPVRTKAIVCRVPDKGEALIGSDVLARLA